MEITWSQTAINTYLSIADYIIDKWTQKELASFQKLVDGLLERIKTDNFICPASKKLNYRKCLVSKQTSLIYRVYKNEIFLITFLDNRTNHRF